MKAVRNGHIDGEIESRRGTFRAVREICIYSDRGLSTIHQCSHQDAGVAIDA